MRNIKNIHTKILLRYLAMTRKFGGWFSICEYGSYGFSSNELKEELAKREHIPSKKEGKLIRQIKAKTKKDKRNGKTNNIKQKRVEIQITRSKKM